MLRKLNLDLKILNGKQVRGVGLESVRTVSVMREGHPASREERTPKPAGPHRTGTGLSARGEADAGSRPWRGDEIPELRPDGSFQKAGTLAAEARPGSDLARPEASQAPASPSPSDAHPSRPSGHSEREVPLRGQPQLSEGGKKGDARPNRDRLTLQEADLPP
jgi:hypothetical protein